MQKNVIERSGSTFDSTEGYTFSFRSQYYMPFDIKLEGITVLTGDSCTTNNMEVVAKSIEELLSSNFYDDLSTQGGLQYIAPTESVVLYYAESKLPPDRQVEMANLICRLSRTHAVKFVIVTNSPIFIRSLEVYADKYNFLHKMNVYLFDGVSATNLSYSEYGLSELYEKFAEQYNQLQELIDKKYNREEQNDNMTFTVAEDLMIKEGKTIARKAWNGKKDIYYIASTELQNTLKYGYGEYEGEPTILGTVAMYDRINNTISMGWHNTDDIMSSDWYVVGEEKGEDDDKMENTKQLGLMDFSDALRLCKQGKKIYRFGWNGKGMFVVYCEGYPNGIPAEEETARTFGIKQGKIVKINPYLTLKCVDGSLSTWVPSINDVLATDWMYAD